MAYPFSFLDHPILGTVKGIFNTFNDVDKVFCALYDPHDRCVKVWNIVRSPDEIDFEDLLLADYLHDVEQERNELEGYNWVMKDEVPFARTDRYPETKKVIYDLLSELNKNVLKLAIDNPFDKKRDLIYLHFRGKSPLLGLTDKSRDLTLDNKRIIGQLIHGFVSEQVRKDYHDQKTLSDYRQDIQNATKTIADAKRSLELNRIDQETSLEMLSRNILENHSVKVHKSYLLAESAAAFCRKYHGDLEKLSPIIIKAAQLAEEMGFADQQGHIIIQEELLKSAMIPTEENTREIRLVKDDLEQKVIDLLNKYERAAETVKAKNLPFNSAAVANHCNKGITASAITDALNRHHKKIIELLKKFPERWPIIRNEFRPLLNMVRKFGSSRGTASA